MHRREEEERVAACNTLGLKPQPTHLELRKAYRALALAHHPDKLPPDASDAQRDAAAARFNEVQEAHDTLMRIFGWAKGAHAGGGGAGGDDGDGGGGGGRISRPSQTPSHHAGISYPVRVQPLTPTTCF